MPVIETGQIILATERSFTFEGMSVSKSDSGWQAITLFGVYNESGAFLGREKIYYRDEDFTTFKNNVFQSDALRKAYLDAKSKLNWSANVPTGVNNEFNN